MTSLRLLRLLGALAMVMTMSADSDDLRMQVHGIIEHMRMHSANASMVCAPAVQDGEINMIDADGDTEVAAVEKGQTPFTHEGASLKDAFKPEVFGGEKKDYPDWIFSFEAYTSFLGLEDVMKEAARHTRPITTAELDEQHAKSAKMLYFVLTQVLRGRACGILRLASKGLEAWRQIKLAYEPDLTERHAAMLMGLLNPEWSHVAGKEFLTKLLDWERAIADYENQSGESFSQATQVAVVLKWAPPKIREFLRSLDVGTDFGKMKVNVEKWVLHHTAYDSGGIPVPEHVVPTPMEVDAAAVTRAGKCYRCGGRGHIARDCPTEDEETNRGDGDHCDFCGGRVAEEPQPTPELSAQVGTVYSAAAPGSGLSEEELYKMCRRSAADGLRGLCESVGISIGNVWAFGDDSNDLRMLSEMGWGVRMANHQPDLAGIGDDVTTFSNAEDGVAKYLQETLSSRSEVVKSNGIPQTFIGVILLPIAGNACEHASAIRFAMQDRPGLAIGISVGSSTQIALLVVPFSVIMAWIVGQPLDLDFGCLNVAVVTLSILVVLTLLLDGRSNWFKGYIMCSMYAFIAVLYWYTPDAGLNQVPSTRP
ncbi:unnamed protein product [Polarella glacialis]|uniref:CCHC-type domain-containing protein n=1 Tax=Polarella glacialis TaxID=89957 RepID=A0A813KP18_POLGL|nr:unnamed protein product [Polarella glacialis]